MKTERLTILMSSDEKAALNHRAQQLDIPTGEYVRRAIANYDPDLESAELVALADELERVVDDTERKVDDALNTLDAFRAFMALPPEQKAARS